MRNKLSNILFGVMLIVIGILFYFRNILTVNTSTLFLIITGVIFFVLYIGQNKKWALILSIYLIYFGILSLLNNFNSLFYISEYHETLVFNKFFYSLGGFFCCPGIIFDILYIRERKSSQLTTGLAFTAAGISIIFGIQIFNSILIGIGTSLLANCIPAHKNKNNIQIIIGILIIIIGLRDIIHIWNIGDLLITIILIICGSIIIIKSILKENN